MWTQADAIDLCRLVEAICPAFGCHVALTGGLLYKNGPRKDCDLVFYRIRQVEEIDVDGLFGALVEHLGFALVTPQPRFVVKATWQGKNVDCLFPEVPSGDYAAEERPLAVSSSTVEELRGWSP